MTEKTKIKIITVVGPTASGKSALAVEIARRFNGEIISADSRQVYRGLNLGTGKITKKEMCEIPHHLLDIANPKRQFSVAQYQKLAVRAVTEIARRGKLPVICGGTGFYVDSIIYSVTLPEVPPSKALRKKLSAKNADELFQMLQKLDPRRAMEIDAKNPARLIRAIEIARAIGNVSPLQKSGPRYNSLIIGLDMPDKILKERIKDRLTERLRKGMVAETNRLHANGLSWKRMEALGLEYRYLARHLREYLSREQMIDELNNAIWQYVKRQRTWFKRDKDIKWFTPTNQKKVSPLIKRFLGKTSFL